MYTVFKGHEDTFLNLSSMRSIRINQIAGFCSPSLRIDIASYLRYCKAMEESRQVVYTDDMCNLPQYAHVFVIICNREQQEDIINEFSNYAFHAVVKADGLSERPFIEKNITMDIKVVDESELTKEFTLHIQKPAADYGLLFVSDFAKFISNGDYEDQRRRIGQLADRCMTGWSVIFFTDTPIEQWYNSPVCQYFNTKHILKIITIDK